MNGGPDEEETRSRVDAAHLLSGSRARFGASRKDERARHKRRTVKKEIESLQPASANRQSRLSLLLFLSRSRFSYLRYIYPPRLLPSSSDPSKEIGFGPMGRASGALEKAPRMKCHLPVFPRAEQAVLIFKSAWLLFPIVQPAPTCNPFPSNRDRPVGWRERRACGPACETQPSEMEEAAWIGKESHSDSGTGHDAFLYSPSVRINASIADRAEEQADRLGESGAFGQSATRVVVYERRTQPHRCDSCPSWFVCGIYATLPVTHLDSLLRARMRRQFYPIGFTLKRRGGLSESPHSAGGRASSKSFSCP
ncbi:hypothetical protein KM043_008147 [Ampulex compressa]|nr:hypothetical protein KM043_008147 [Ampulex compressa]